MSSNILTTTYKNIMFHVKHYMKGVNMFENIKKELNNITLQSHYGKVNKIVGTTIESSGPICELGELCYVHTSSRKIPCEVIGFNQKSVVLMAFEDIFGVKLGDRVYSSGSTLEIRVGDELKGKVLNGLGLPIDNTTIKSGDKKSIYSKPVSALQRKIISEPLEVGVKAIDALLPLGKGQRIGLFAGSGVGKSTLLTMIAKSSKADINVIALVGERGREVQEFISELGPEGLEKSIVVVATSDEPALMRVKASLTATTIAEYFRDKGLDVVLMMDSVTRYASAQREISINTGEKVAQRGYTPSVFAMIPKLLERAGTSETGSITGIYTVLVDGDDMNEPIADTTRGVLDGHIVLKRDLAHKGHYPAIDILSSISRITKNICTPEHCSDMSKFRELLSDYRDVEDLISIGAYKQGSNSKSDKAIALHDECISFLKQNHNDYVPRTTSINELTSIVEK